MDREGTQQNLLSLNHRQFYHACREFSPLCPNEISLGSVVRRNNSGQEFSLWNRKRGRCCCRSKVIGTVSQHSRESCLLDEMLAGGHFIRVVTRVRFVTAKTASRIAVWTQETNSSRCSRSVWSRSTRSIVFSPVCAAGTEPTPPCRFSFMKFLRHGDSHGRRCATIRKSIRNFGGIIFRAKEYATRRFSWSALRREKRDFVGEISSTR